MEWVNGRKVSRNDPCPCGSGRKLKKCCLKLIRNLKQKHIQDYLPDMGTYLSALDLWPEPIDEDDVLAFFRRYDGEDLAQTLARFGVILQDRSRKRANDAELELLQIILPPIWFKKAYLWLHSGKCQTALPRILLLTAIRFSMICPQTGKRGIKIRGNEKNIGPALLQLSSILEEDTTVLLKKAKTQPEKRSVLAASFYRNAFYDHPENQGTELGRYWALLMKAPEAVQQRFPKEAYCFNERYKELLGFSVLIKIGITQAVYRYYQRPVEAIIGNPRRFLLGEGYLNGLIDEVRDAAFKALKSLSMKWSEHVSRMKRISGNGIKKKLQFFTLYDKPFVETDGAGFYPLDTQFVSQQGTEGIYWELFNALKADGATAELTLLRTHFGRCVEWYVSEIMRPSALKEPKVVWLDWDDDFKTNKEVSVPDAVVYHKEILYFIEVTTSAVTPAVAISGEPHALREALEKIWFKGHGKRPGKLVQLQRAIDAYSNGLLMLNGLDGRPVRSVLPVIVTLRPLPQFPIISDWYRQIMEENGLSANFINTVTFTDLREIEAISSAQATEIDWGIIERKLNSPSSTSSLSNFMVYNLKISEIPRHAKVQEWMHESFDAIEHSLFGRSI